MEVHFFDVEHGSCALIRTDTNKHMLVDCGHSGERNWRPSQFLPACGIGTVDRLFITNWDEDHASDLPGLFQSVHVPILHRNPTASPHYILGLKQEHGPGEGILSLAYMAANHYVTPVINPPDLGAMSFSEYWNTPLHGFNDTNNLGLVVFFHYFDLHVVFPGDLEEEGWLQLLQNPGFRYELTRSQCLRGIGNYGLNRGIAAGLLVVVVATLLQTPINWLAVTGVGVAAALATYRMHRFARHYARELFVQFLQLPAKESNKEKK